MLVSVTRDPTAARLIPRLRQGCLVVEPRTPAAQDSLGVTQWETPPEPATICQISRQPCPWRCTGAAARTGCNPATQKARGGAGRRSHGDTHQPLPFPVNVNAAPHLPLRKKWLPAQPPQRPKFSCPLTETLREPRHTHLLACTIPSCKRIPFGANAVNMARLLAGPLLTTFDQKLTTTQVL